MIPLTTTDPGAIANLARCFSCNSDLGINELALRTYLLTQVGNIATPPCVTPIAAPTSTGAKVTTATTIRIGWFQPANSGSLITSYLISWGTASGVYTNSASVGAGVRQYTITGLTSGTQYFWVIKAVSFSGCTSANSSESNATTSGGVPLDPAVTAWVNRVVANGGTAPTNATQQAVSTFWIGVKSAGLDTKILWLNFFARDNLTAALTPFILGATKDPWTNTGGNFVAGDLSINGLTGNALNKQLGLGFGATVIWGATTLGSLGVVWYAYNATATGLDFGSAGGAGTSWNENGAKFSDGNSYDRNGGSGASIVIVSKGNGYYSSQRTNNTTHNLYFANSTNAHASVGSDAVDITGQVQNNLEPLVFNFNNNGVNNFFSSDTLSFLAGTTGLSSADDNTLFNLVQALETALGGGFR